MTTILPIFLLGLFLGLILGFALWEAIDRGRRAALRETHRRLSLSSLSNLRKM